MIYSAIIKQRKPYASHAYHNPEYIAELAFHKLITKYPAICRIQEYEDLLQDCYVLSYEKWESYSTYDCAVASNHIVRAIIAKKTSNKHFEKLEAEQIFFERSQAAYIHNLDEMEELICLHLDMEAIQKLLPSINIQNAEKVLYMRFVDNMTLTEIGRALNVSPVRARDIESAILRRFRHPSRVKLLNFSIKNR